jgi:hypothetical protein
MTLDTIQDLLSRRPFEPFHIVTSSGKTYDVRHPEMAWPIRNGVYVGMGRHGKIPDRAAFVSLLHIAAVEESDNGSKKRK